MSKWRPSQFSLICLYCGALGVWEGIYLVIRAEPPVLLALLGRWGLVLLIVSWVEAQSPGWPTIDFGALLLMGWSVVFPYYLIRTRGIRGIGYAAALFASYFVPLFVAGCIRALR